MQHAGWALAADSTIRKFLHKAGLGRDTTCSAVSRSLGTHIFLNFGELTYNYNQSGVAVPYGDIRLCLHAYHWQLFCSGEILMRSETVSDEDLSRVFETRLRASPFPQFVISENGLLRLVFGPNIEIQVEPDTHGADDDCYEPEVEITTRHRDILELSLTEKSCSVGKY